MTEWLHKLWYIPIMEYNLALKGMDYREMQQFGCTLIALC